MTKFVECEGYVWELSDKAYKELLVDIARDKDVDLDKFGKVVVKEMSSLYCLQAKARNNAWCHNILGGEDDDE